LLLLRPRRVVGMSLLAFVVLLLDLRAPLPLPLPPRSPRGRRSDCVRWEGGVRGYMVRGREGRREGGEGRGREGHVPPLLLPPPSPPPLPPPPLELQPLPFCIAPAFPSSLYV